MRWLSGPRSVHACGASVHAWGGAVHARGVVVHGLVGVVHGVSTRLVSNARSVPRVVAGFPRDGRTASFGGDRGAGAGLPRTGNAAGRPYRTPTVAECSTHGNLTKPITGRYVTFTRLRAWTTIGS